MSKWNHPSHLILMAALAVGGLAATSANAQEATTPAQSWAGFYAGLEAGTASDSADWKTQSVGPNNVYGVYGNTAKSSFSNTEGRLGLYLGKNFAFGSNLVLGYEGDVSGLFGGGDKKINGQPGVAYKSGSSDTLTWSQNVDASIRARAGYAVDSSLLVFGTAGVAIRDASFTDNCPGNASSWCGASEKKTLTQVLAGWTIGTGAEYKLTNNLSVRLEYRYEDFGPARPAFFGSSNYGTDSISTKTTLSSHVVGLGVTYHFGNLLP